MPRQYNNTTVQYSLQEVGARGKWCNIIEIIEIIESGDLCLLLLFKKKWRDWASTGSRTALAQHCYVYLLLPVRQCNVLI